MLDLLIAIGAFTVGSVVFIYTWTRLVITMKLQQYKLEFFLAIMCPTHTLSFWSIDQEETWRLFSKVTKRYWSHYYIDAKRVNGVRWWVTFLNDCAVN